MTPVRRRRHLNEPLFDDDADDDDADDDDADDDDADDDDDYEAFEDENGLLWVNEGLGWTYLSGEEWIVSPTAPPGYRVPRPRRSIVGTVVAVIGALVAGVLGLLLVVTGASTSSSIACRLRPAQSACTDATWLIVGGAALLGVTVVAVLATLVRSRK